MSRRLAEREIYPDIQAWLLQLLQHRYANAQVYNPASLRLSKLISQTGLSEKMPSHWTSWDIKVDIVGIATDKKGQTHLAFVECKVVPISLAHLGQLLGYCRVAQPDYAFLVSPKGVSSALQRLLEVFHREDILQYQTDKSGKIRNICIARWDEQRRTIASESILPRGYVIP
ncbi:MAG: hypothetical protein SNJ72_08325 [Fimbriimonadales bacterium]